MREGVVIVMSIDENTVRRTAELIRIKLEDYEVRNLQLEINDVLDFLEQINKLDLSDLPPTVGSVSEPLSMYDDVVEEGGIAKEILDNATMKRNNFFVCPRVVKSR